MLCLMLETCICLAAFGSAWSLAQRSRQLISFNGAVEDETGLIDLLHILHGKFPKLPVLMTYVTHDWASHVNTLICQLAKQPSRWPLIVATEGETASRSLQRRFKDYSPQVELGVVSVASKDPHGMKIRLAHAAVVQARVPVLVLDVDLALLGNFWPSISSTADAQFMFEDFSNEDQVYRGKGTINTGFVYWSNTDNARDMLSGLVKVLDNRRLVYDQADDEGLVANVLCCMESSGMAIAVAHDCSSEDDTESRITASRCEALMANFPIHRDRPSLVEFFPYSSFRVDDQSDYEQSLTELSIALQNMTVFHFLSARKHAERMHKLAAAGVHCLESWSTVNH